MSTALQFTPPRVPMVDLRTGTITREWMMFLQGLYTRTGGASGKVPGGGGGDAAGDTLAPTGDAEALAFGLELAAAVGQVPLQAPAITEEYLLQQLAAVQAAQTVLERAIEDLKQGYQI